MWIKCTNDATRRLFNDDVVDEDGEQLLEEPLEFTSNATAQVTREIGEVLCDHYDDIRPYEAED